MIGSKRSGKERTEQTQFSTKFDDKLSFMPPLEALCAFFLPVFWNLIPYVTKKGVPMPSFPDFTNYFNVDDCFAGVFCQVHIMFILTSLCCHFAI